MQNNTNLISDNKIRRFFSTIKTKIKSIFSFKKDHNVCEFQSEDYVMDILPKLREYSEIELSNLANIEKKLQDVIKANKKAGTLVQGIKPKEAEEIIEWIAQSGRKNLFEDFPINSSLQGACGYGQAINGETMINMGLNPYIYNVNKTFDPKSSHAYSIGEIPVNENGIIKNESYLFDMTFRQFFTKHKITYKNWINDERFGGDIGSLPGYWLLQTKEGRKLANEILYNGYFKINPEKLKLYGDSFILAGTDTIVPPKKTELYTGNSPEKYLSAIKNRENEDRIDYVIGELEGDFNLNLKTPLMQRKELMNIVSSIPKEQIDELKKEKLYKENEAEK